MRRRKEEEKTLNEVKTRLIDISLEMSDILQSTLIDNSIRNINAILRLSGLLSSVEIQEDRIKWFKIPTSKDNLYIRRLEVRIEENIRLIMEDHAKKEVESALNPPVEEGEEEFLK